MDALLLLGVSAAVLAVLAPVINALRRRSETHVTLYLRALRKPGGDMLGGSDVDNVFTDEFNRLFLKSVHVLDYAVMKYVASDCEFVTRQEHLHAKMHHEGERVEKSTGDAALRWRFPTAIMDFIFLRCGKTVGTACAGYIEAIAAEIFDFSIVKLPFVRWFPNDLVLFHVFEEMEHGELTVQSLGNKTNALSRIATYPIMTLVFFLFFVSPPLFLLVSSPLLLLRPKTYADLTLYYLTFLPAFAYTLWLMVTRWILLLPENPANVARRYAALKQKVAVRGIAYDIQEQETYKLMR